SASSGTKLSGPSSSTAPKPLKIYSRATASVRRKLRNSGKASAPFAQQSPDSQARSLPPNRAAKQLTFRFLPRLKINREHIEPHRNIALRQLPHIVMRHFSQYPFLFRIHGSFGRSHRPRSPRLHLDKAQNILF